MADELFPPEAPRDELKRRPKDKPNVRLHRPPQKPEGLSKDQVQSIISNMNMGRETPFWKLLTERFTKLENFYLQELQNAIPVGEGAAKIARAQEGLRLIRSIKTMPEDWVRDLTREGVA